MKKIYFLQIPYNFPTFNSEINKAKQHWAIYAKHKSDWTNFVALHARNTAIITNYPCHLTITIFDKTKRKDIDGMGSIAVKYILDGLQQAGVIQQDSLQYISGYTVIWGGVDKDDPHIDIELSLNT